MDKILIIASVILASSDIKCVLCVEENSSSDQKVLMRKLHEIADSNRNNETESTWNDVIADEIIDRSKIFPHNKEPEEKPKFKEELSLCLSSVLKWYKSNIYDAFFGKRPAEIAIPEPVSNPKEEVELIEPMYHGRLCDGCEDECPDGEERDSLGNCVNSRMILRVPFRCPAGFRKDSAGYCREMW